VCGGPAERSTCGRSTIDSRAATWKTGSRDAWSDSRARVTVFYDKQEAYHEGRGLGVRLSAVDAASKLPVNGPHRDDQRAAPMRRSRSPKNHTAFHAVSRAGWLTRTKTRKDMSSFSAWKITLRDRRHGLDDPTCKEEIIGSGRARACSRRFGIIRHSDIMARHVEDERSSNRGVLRSTHFLSIVSACKGPVVIHGRG